MNEDTDSGHMCGNTYANRACMQLCAPVAFQRMSIIHSAGNLAGIGTKTRTHLQMLVRETCGPSQRKKMQVNLPFRPLRISLLGVGGTVTTWHVVRGVSIMLNYVRCYSSGMPCGV